MEVPKDCREGKGECRQVPGSATGNTEIVEHPSDRYAHSSTQSNHKYSKEKFSLANSTMV